jgi:hypothetical protein
MHSAIMHLNLSKKCIVKLSETDTAFTEYS